MNGSRTAFAFLGGALLVMPQRVPAQATCAPELEALQRDLRAFDEAGRQLPPGFPRADAEEAAVDAARQGLGGDINARLTRWNDRIKKWADGVAGYRQCLADSGCNLGNFIAGQDAVSRETADWLRAITQNGNEAAAQAANRAANVLVDYTAGSGGRMIGSIAKALSCTAANPPQPASPRAPAKVPPLPPDTVNQTGLEWNLAIGECTVKGPFRFSLCTGQYLSAGETSGPCSPSSANGIVGGHNANYVFSAGHGQFLPKGLGVDGNGILHGDSCKLIPKGTQLPLCVRQLDVERCGAYKVGQQVAQADPKAKGGGAGGKVLAALVVAGGAAYGAKYLSDQAQLDTGTGSSCPTLAQCCGGVGRGGGCGIPAQCNCPSGTVTGGICQPGSACASLVGAGNRICNGC